MHLSRSRIVIASHLASICKHLHSFELQSCFALESCLLLGIKVRHYVLLHAVACSRLLLQAVTCNQMLLYMPYMFCYWLLRDVTWRRQCSG